MKLILASNSPRRKELLAKLPYTFEVIPAECDEVTPTTVPTDLVCELASRKAKDVYSRHSDCVVLGCDTVVDLDGVVLGKPQDEADAIATLRRLSGVTHKVHTGVCIVCPVGEWLFCDSTDVTFRKLDEREIVDYVRSGAAYGKAGSYGIQDSGFVQSYSGDYDNVVGMPVYKVDKILQQIYKG